MTSQQLQPLDTAPKDGTVVYALIDGTDYAQPIKWGYKSGKPTTSRLQWRMAWDDYPVSAHEIQGWHSVPEYAQP